MLQHKSLTSLDSLKPLFLPRFIASSIAEVDFDALPGFGITTVLVDLDNTLLVKGSFKIEPTVLEALRKTKLPLYIATNRSGHKNELEELGKTIKAVGIIQAEGWRRKPFKAFFEHAQAVCLSNAEEIIMIGDRLWQDVWGANRSGLSSLMIGHFGKKTLLDHFFGQIDQLILKPFRSQYISI